MRQMMKTFLVLGVLGLALGAFGQERGAAPRLRVGTYDNRAIAVAFAASRFNPVAEKWKEHAAAKAAGDAARVRALELWGEAHQRALHRQGFGRVPVDDLLAPVKDRLPEVARRVQVDAIAWTCDYVSAAAETVDVTRELVELFEPSAATLARIEELRMRPFVGLDEIEEHQDH
jgi:hypothetical protein